MAVEWGNWKTPSSFEISLPEHTVLRLEPNNDSDFVIFDHGEEVECLFDQIVPGWLTVHFFRQTWQGELVGFIASKRTGYLPVEMFVEPFINKVGEEVKKAKAYTETVFDDTQTPVRRFLEAHLPLVAMQNLIDRLMKQEVARLNEEKRAELQALLDEVNSFLDAAMNR